MRKLAALLVVGLLAGSASAAMTLVVSDEGLLGVTDGSGNPLAYMVLTAVGSASEHPNTWVGSATGNLHQAWAYGAVATPTETTAIAGRPITLDTHFTVLDTEIVSVTAPNEDAGAFYDNMVTYPPYSLGYGTHLSGDFSDITASAETWECAYLVGIAGEWVTANVTLASNEGTENDVLEGYQFVPEPATLALLGLGGLATLIRRRR